MTPKHFETDAIRQQLDRTNYGEHSSPLFLTSSFVFDDAEHMRASFAEENDQNIYSRFSNPNTSEFIDKVVTMEGAEAGFAAQVPDLDQGLPLQPMFAADPEEAASAYGLPMAQAG